MEKSQGSSFIPKSPVRATTKPRGTRRVFIFTYVAFVFFFGTIIATIGIFVWGVTIDQQLATKKENLAEERKLFDQAALEGVRELETRMNTAYSILDRQVSVYSIFEALEKKTLHAVQIIGFDYSKDTNNALDVSLVLTTANFNSSLYQRKIFSENSILDGAKISEITYVDTVDPEQGAVFASASKITYKVSKKFSPIDIPYVPTKIQEIVVTETETETDISGEVDSSENPQSTDGSFNNEASGNAESTEVNNQVGI